MTQKRLVLSQVYKSFGPKKVLQGLSLDLHAGESLVVIGGSGTGKSVMLKCILGLLPVDQGSILLDNQELVHGSSSLFQDARRKISMLFQGSALFDSLPVWENVAFGLLQNRSLERHEARDLALDRLAAVGLPEDVGDLYPAELSGGMQRRVALARAIASRPEILFFDEPTAGLDPIMAGLINGLIRSSVKESGAAALTITHDMASARCIADRIAMIYQGQIVWQGSAQDIDRSGNPYVDQFIHGRTQGPIHIEVR